MGNRKFHKVLFSLALSLLACLFSAKLQARYIAGKSPGHAGDSHFNQDGFLKINGTARLVIGLYELPKEDAILKEMAENGFNLVRSTQDVKTLDRIHKHELYGWICLGSAAKLKEVDEKSEQKLAQIINDFKNHPALLVWELPDEALWNIWWSRSPWVFGGQQRELRKHIEKAKSDTIGTSIAGFSSLLEKANDYNQRGLFKRSEEIYDRLWKELQIQNPHPDWKESGCPADVDRLSTAIARGCKVIRQFDPGHIIWQNHAPRNSVKSLQKYNQAVDAAGCDIYPVPFNPSNGHSGLKDTNLSSVGAYTDRMRAASPGKSMWMVLQGFGWRDLKKESEKESDPAKGRRPNFHESRFMAYDAVVQGANAILYWGTHYIEKDSSLWRDLMKIARELRALEPAILGQLPKTIPVAIADETYGSIDGQGPQLLLGKTGKDWVLIAVNENNQSIAFTVSRLPKEIEGKTLYRLYSDESHIVKQGLIRDGIRGFGVHVYATSRCFEVARAWRP
ncbi:MAG TPA: hypothetical protein HPP66_10445 [Planctomycetes bacterium]|nr:hypothetical protein [Planctomycetota bacterium]